MPPRVYENSSFSPMGTSSNSGTSISCMMLSEAMAIVPMPYGIAESGAVPVPASQAPLQNPLCISCRYSSVVPSLPKANFGASRMNSFASDRNFLFVALMMFSAVGSPVSFVLIAPAADSAPRNPSMFGVTTPEMADPTLLSRLFHVAPMKLPSWLFR